MEVSNPVCIICSTTEEGGRLINRGWRDDRRFRDFLEVLEGGSSFKGVDFLSNLEGRSQQAGLCRSCGDLVSETVEAREMAKVGECKVLKLQKEILEELRGLQGNMREFYGRMRRIEENMTKGDRRRSSNVTVSGEEENQEREGWKGKRRRSKRKKKEHLGEEGDHLLLFRERITEVVQDLACFHSQLINKIGPAPEKAKIHLTQFEQTTGSTPKLESASVDIKHEPDLEDLATYEAPISPIPALGPADLHFMEEPQTLADIQLEDNLNDDPTYSEKTENELPENKISNEEASTSNPNPHQIRRQKTPYKRKPDTALKLTTLNLKGLSPFQQEVVQAVYRSQVRYETGYPQNPDPSELLNMPLDIRYPFKFHSPTQQLTIASSPVTMTTDTINCTLCNFTTPPRGDLPLKKIIESIYNHVAGFHFNAFQCHLCPKRLPSRKKFKEHLSDHRKSCICDICGKPLGSPDTVGIHKWLHLNAEEKAEALRTGKAPALVKRKLKVAQVPEWERETFKCSICGKDFGNKQNLLKHEERHQEGTVVCPKCGKEMKRSSYRVYHMKYTCPMGSYEANKNKHRCLECENSFQTLGGLRLHVKRTHSREAVERPHLCAICGKGYKTDWDMRYHMKTHGEGKVWRCEKCGREFNMKRNLTRHQCRKGGGSKGDKK